MLLCWKLVDETQMSNPHDHAARNMSSKFSILLPLRSVYFRSFLYETPCTMYTDSRQYWQRHVDRHNYVLWPELASRVFGWTELLSEDVSQTRQSFICPQVYYKAKRHIGGFAKGLMYYTVMWYIREWVRLWKLFFGFIFSN